MQDSNSDMALKWTDVDHETNARRDVFIHQQNVLAKDLIQSELPTDIHMVVYYHEGKNYSDAVRAAKMVDIFDVYYDKMKEVGKGGTVLSIKSGYGTIKPKLYNPDKKKDNK